MFGCIRRFNAEGVLNDKYCLYLSSCYVQTISGIFSGSRPKKRGSYDPLFEPDSAGLVPAKHFIHGVATHPPGTRQRRLRVNCRKPHYEQCRCHDLHWMNCRKPHHEQCRCRDFHRMNRRGQSHRCETLQKNGHHCFGRKSLPHPFLLAQRRTLPSHQSSL